MKEVFLSLSMNKELHILMVEDSEADAALILLELTQAGYRAQYERVETEPAFLAALDGRSWNIILCDYSLPAFDGLSALRLFKQRNLDIPFIFVSGAISEDIAVGAMKSGAHDYVMKANLRRLAPAVERELHDAADRLEKRKLHEETARIQKELAKKDELFRSLIEHSSDGVSLLDGSGRVVYESPSMHRIFGYDAGTEHREDFFRYIHPDDLVRAKRAFSRLAGSPGGIFYNEVRVKHSDNSWRWIETVGHNLLSDDKVGAIVVNYRDITERKRAEEELRRSQEQLRALAANLQVAREEERRNIAREFHDHLGQSLTALRMALSVLHRGITNREKQLSRAALANELQSIQQEIDRITQSVRQTMSELRPELLDQAGLLAALASEADRLQRRSGIRCRFTSNVEDLRLDPLHAIALFRVFQEALTNVVRHAQATEVDVCVHVSEDELVMTINDNGVGIDPGAEERIDSHGLIGMRERALLLNGTFSIAGEKGVGTRITVRMPLNQSVSTLPAEP
jgi:two-component system, NarL family, sensor histidine kinase UhpB